MELKYLPETPRETMLFEEIKRLMVEVTTRDASIKALEQRLHTVSFTTERSRCLDRKLEESTELLFKQALLIIDLCAKIKELEEYDR